jgi:alkyl hydroperoxide reductase subunit AhpF
VPSSDGGRESSKLLTTMSVGNTASRPAVAVARVEAEPTTIAVVSVTPMSRAVAVAAVRRGFRVALPAARRAGQAVHQRRLA